MKPRQPDAEPPTPEHATPEAAETPAAIGLRLRQAREARNESVPDIAAQLKLSTRQINALESGDYEALPGPAFTRGFLRNYARHLGLDPASITSVALEEAVKAPVSLSPISNADADLPYNSGSRFNAAPITTLVLLLILILLAGWWFDWFDPNPTNDTTATQSNGATFIPAPGMNYPDTAAQPEESHSPTSAAENISSPPEDTATEKTENRATLEFRFNGTSWIEVRNATGQVIYSGTGAAGQKQTVQGLAPFSLILGDAPSIELHHNGTKVDLAPYTRGTVARLTLE